MQRTAAEAVRELNKPVVAAVHGYCLGAGLESALMADFRICTADARLGVPAVKLGLPYRLEDILKVVDVVGLARAREMVLLGRQYGGEEAFALGVAHRLVPDRAALAEAANEIARELAGNAPLSLAAAKVAFREAARRDAPPDLDLARRFADACYASHDYAEGRAARREKRPPRFEGR
jgi:enoyl-CoA hydratase